MSVPRLSLVTLALLTLIALGCRGEAGTRAVQKGTASASAQPRALETATLAVSGMTCTGCELGVEHVLKRVPGVVWAEADYETGEAWAEYDPSQTSPQELVQAIESLGYSARPAGTP